jgi:hypothetical protein
MDKSVKKAETENIVGSRIAYLGSPKTPAFMVSSVINLADLGSTLEALLYCSLKPAPEGTKKAPFTKMSSSVLQFQSAHSPSFVSTLFVTYKIFKKNHRQRLYYRQGIL